jgi:3-hydroxybutyryl-CoA dehydrogenase
MLQRHKTLWHISALVQTEEKVMAIQTVGIIGAGTMGNGIAQACAVSGLQAVMLDINDAAVQKGVKTIAGSLERLVKKEKMSVADRDAVLARVKATTQMADLAAADIVIEAATENLELKLKILKDVDALLKPEAILASNTSSISITKLAAATGRADRFLGMHFFNPVPVMALVEIICGLQTSDATHAAVEALAKQLGKTPITVKNNPGFVVNRLLVPMINEAAFVYGEGVASAEEIDNGMKLGCNHPIGPLALADLIGLDTCLAIMEVFYKEFADSKYRAAPVLRELVAAGRLGRKTGRGFYSYS